MRILILLLLVSFSSFGQLLNNNMMQSGGSVYEVHKFAVQYNTTPYSYITSKTGYNGDASFNTGANVIGVAIVSATNNNTGLWYNSITDRIVCKIGTVNYFISREDFATAAAASYGTIPTFSGSVNGSNSHGISVDPLTGLIYESQGNQQFKILDSGGSELETVTVSAVPQFSMLHYEWISGILYTTEDAANGRVYGVKDNGSSWDLVYTSDFFSSDGVSYDYFKDKLLVFNNDRLRWQDTTGLNIIMLPTDISPLPGQNGLIVDPMDETVWYNTTNDSTLHHTDPLNKYRQYFNNHMFNWSDWQLGNNSYNGDRFFDEKLVGNQFSIGPVIDFGSHTGQQTLGNWTVSNGDNAVFEFRGSASAPTTTPLSSRDYHTLVLYDPNESNDGWGSTSPGAWQSTPTTDRYMQVRIKPIAPDPPDESLTPFDLDSDLIAWWSTSPTPDGEATERLGAYQDVLGIAGTGNQIPRMINVADPDPSSDFVQATTGQRPIMTSNYASMEASNRHLNATGQTALTALIESLGECEVHIIGVKPAGTSNAIYLSASETSSNNNRVVLRHYGSGATPANMLAYQIIDAAGTSNIYGVTDASGTTARLLTFKFGSGTNSILINNVDQGTLTVNTGSNSGQQFNDYSGINNVSIGRTLASTPVSGTTRVYEILVTAPLTSQEREDYIMDYFAAKGLITP